MRILRLVNHGDHKSVFVDDREYSFQDESRGVREKFWLTREKTNLYYEPMSLREILFKYNRTKASYEDYGEIISSRVAKQIGLDCVDYYLAGMYEDDSEDLRHGVICGSYKKNNDEKEFSVENLQFVMSTPDIDTQTGEYKNINTVDGICDALETFKQYGVTDEQIYKIRIELLKQVIFDFLLAQTDRHCRNTSILMSKDTGGRCFIRKAPCYDNGCISFLKLKLAKIIGRVQMIEAKGIEPPYIEQMMASYIPLTGVKTQTIDVHPCKNWEGLMRVDAKQDAETKEQFLNELAREILTIPELAVFYIQLKERLNMAEVFNRIEMEGDKVDPYVQKLVTYVVDYQLNDLEKAVQRNKVLLKEVGDV